MCLEKQHPDVAKEFHQGNFVVHKSDRNFSAMTIDQAHEQNTTVIKGDGGAIGVTEDPSALRRWMVAGPEISRLVANYETVSGTKDAKKNNRHHEQTETVQRAFFEKVKQLTKVMEEMGNPFEEESGYLLTLDTKDIADPSAAQLIATHHERGKDKFNSFMANLQCENDCSFYQPIKKNRITFFTNEPKSASKSETKLLKEDCNLFSRLFISCQNRQCDLQEFFKHENQSFPASLSNKGKLHTCTKSDLVDVLQAKVTLPETKPESDVLIVDGSALVNTVAPRTPKSFEEYARTDILPKVEYYSMTHKRTDIIFDVYHQSSLKAEARCKRGKAIRRRVTATSKTPSNWQSFLRDSTNKTELFHFLADKVAEMTTGNPVIMTKGEDAITTISDTSVNLEEVVPCSHEEADTRIFVHARHAAIEGYKSLMKLMTRTL